ncbi:acetyl-CoA carboxylase biotin carboxyl carrier protein [bacterium]|nr:MAG: acetyl-CoA carboxylase biotin carboxyl carrier protein [bacterium]
MDIKKVRDLVKLVEESGIEELEVTDNDSTIRIQKSVQGTIMAAPPAMTVPVPVVGAPEASPAAAEQAAAAPAQDGARARWKDVRSPIVGTFYRSPSPTSESFVQVGDHVASGQPLCIVEAMKVMNEIEAEFSGTIREILVENGSPVEAEAALFLVDPD